MKKLSFLSQFKPLFGKYRYKVCFSGRGSAKSTHIAIALIWYASRCKMKILCVREHLNSIKDSSKAQIELIIEQSGTMNQWTITNTEIIHKHTGSVFLFKGIATNYNSIKSIPDIDICWVEECETLSQESLNVLIPTIRKQNSQIWFSGNPKDRMQAVSQLFIENEPPPDTVIISNDYRDNPYISATLLAEAMHMRDSNPEMYSHVWLGEYLDTANMILVKNATRGEVPRLVSDKCVIGVDIARDGGDRTVICVRKGKNIEELLIFPTMELNLLTHQLQTLIFKHKPEQINVDSTGHGAWVPDGLKSTGVSVTSVSFNGSAKHADRYSNVRSELYGLAEKYFANGGKIRFNDIELERELEASYYTLDNKNRIALVPKTEIKKRIGKSPDIADAFCLSLLCVGDMFMSTVRADKIAMANHTSSLLKSGAW